MIPWAVAFKRCIQNAQFKQYFGSKIQEGDFRGILYNQVFATVSAGTVASTTSIITGGTINGPLTQNFPVGAVILGITAAAYQQQFGVAAGFQYAPSQAPGRRDLFGLNFAYTGTEQLTPGGPVLAETLLGSGSETIFPPREIVVAPSQGIVTSAQAFCVNADLTVHVGFHSMVLKTAN